MASTSSSVAKPVGGKIRSWTSWARLVPWASHLPQPNTPEDTIRRFQQGATAARKRLEEFLAERLTEAVPPLGDDLPLPFQEAVKTLEPLDDNALWTVARSQLPPAQERQYRQLLAKNSQGTITAHEKVLLQTLGEEARLLTLKKAHAYLLLTWRGHPIPSPDAPHRHG